MKRQKGKNTGFPTPNQELLLRACLLKGEAALDAWTKWKEECDFEKIDAASYRLMPLLHQNLKSQQVEDPLMAKLQGIHRKTWYQNQILVFKATKILKTFQELGIETMVLKGMALSLLYYKDLGLRPMGDIDIFVPRARIAHAVQVLAENGWLPIGRSLQSLNDDYFDLRHAHGFADSQKQQFDLHWHLLLECCSKEADEVFWTGAQPLNLNGIPTLAPNATDQLFHVLIHGLQRSTIPTIRWVADAAITLDQAGKEIDWLRFYESAETFKLGLQLSRTLSYLHRLREDLVPDTILQRLHSMPKSKKEKREYSRKTGEPGILGNWPQHWDNYMRIFRQTGNVPNRFSLIWNFPAYITNLRGDKNFLQTLIRGLKSKVFGKKQK